MLLSQAGTKVRPDQLGTASPDQLGSNKKIKIKQNWTQINSDHKKKNKVGRHHLPFTRHFVFFSHELRVA